MSDASDLEARLERCFLAVFPDLDRREVAGASADTLEAWDSVTFVTLVAVVEEEFAVDVELDAFEDLTSFDDLAAYLRERTRREQQAAPGDGG